MFILFFGSDPWFSPIVLDALLKAGHDVPVIVTKGEAFGEGRRLRTKGQGKSIVVQAKTPADITRERLEKILHQALGVRPEDSAPRGTRHQQPDATIVASFGPPFLPDDLLDWPRFGCLNVHASLLPRWRGASPVAAAIAAGDDETGVTIMKMTKEIDRGPILGQQAIPIRHPSFERPGSAISQGQAFSDEYDTRETLTRRLGMLGGKLIVETLKKLEKGQIKLIKQPGKSPTSYTRRLTKNDGRIDWTIRPGETRPERSRRIDRFIRAVTPWPSATTTIKYQKSNIKNSKEKMTIEIENVKILKAHLERLRTTNYELRTVLVPDLVQLPGKKPVTWRQFLAGHPGARLG